MTTLKYSSARLPSLAVLSAVLLSQSNLVQAETVLDSVIETVESLVDNSIESVENTLNSAERTLFEANIQNEDEVSDINVNASQSRELKKNGWYGDGYYGGKPGKYGPPPGYYGPPPGHYGPPGHGHGPPPMWAGYDSYPSGKSGKGSGKSSKGSWGGSSWGGWGSGKSSKGGWSGSSWGGWGSGKSSKGSGKSSKSEGWGGWRDNSWGGNGGWGGWGSGKSGKGSKGSGKSGKGSGKSSKGGYNGGMYYYTHTHGHDHGFNHDAWSDDGWNGSGKSGKGGGWGGYSGKGGKGGWGGYEPYPSKGGKSQYGQWVWVDDGGWSDDGWSGDDGWSDDWSGSGKSGKGGWGGSGSGKSGKGYSNYPADDDSWSGGSKSDDGDSWGGWDNDGWGTDGWNADGWDNDGHYKADILYVRSEVMKLIDDSERELVPKFLRLGFHDCVGGCDGCVDLTNPDNFGLDEPIEALGYIVNKYKNSYSRADIWALATLTAADMAIEKGDRPEGLGFPMRYFGRRDCKGADHLGRGGPDREMPSNDYTTHELLKYFKDVFGFNTDETVTIMGVHSVAIAHRENSGFGLPDREVGWVFDADKYILNNRYYAMIVGDYEHGIDHPVLAPEWEVEFLINDKFPGQPNRHQWYHPNGPDDERPIMLNADIALVRDLDGYLVHRDDGTFGQVNCFFNKASRDDVLADGNGLVTKNEIKAEINPEANFGFDGGEGEGEGGAEVELRTLGFRRNLKDTPAGMLPTSQQEAKKSQEQDLEDELKILNLSGDKLGNLRNLKELPPMCPMASETIHIALEYKMDNHLWLLEFQDALEKMLRNGYFEK